MKTQAYEQLHTRMNTTPWKLWALIAKEHAKEFDYLIALDDWLYAAMANDQVGRRRPMRPNRSRSANGPSASRAASCTTPT